MIKSLQVFTLLFGFFLYFPTPAGAETITGYVMTAPLRQEARWEVFEYGFRQPFILSCKKNLPLRKDVLLTGLFFAKGKLTAVLKATSSTTREEKGKLIYQINEPPDVEVSIEKPELVDKGEDWSLDFPGSDQFLSSFSNIAVDIVKRILELRREYVREQGYFRGKEKLEEYLGLYGKGKEIIVKYKDGEYPSSSYPKPLPMVMAMDLDEKIFELSEWRKKLDKEWDDLKGSYSIDRVDKLCLSAFDFVEQGGKRVLKLLKLVVAKDGKVVVEEVCDLVDSVPHCVSVRGRNKAR
jgi:hypothetical protein